MRLFIPFTVLFVAMIAAVSAVSSHLYYTGFINGKLAIQMDLTFSKGKVSGQYTYDAVGNQLELTGTIMKTGVIAMTESVPVGDTDRITGHFTGMLSADRLRIDGQWQDATGKSTLPFHLRAVAEYHRLTVKHRLLEEHGEYPYFLDPSPAWKALNVQLYEATAAALQAVRKEITDDELDNSNDCSEDYTQSIAFYRPDLVSVLATELTYLGGAHPCNNFSSANYRITASGPRLLGLNDLFDAKTPYMDAVTDLLLAELERESATGDNDPKAALQTFNFTPEDMKAYTCSATGITFYFPHGVLDAYAMGDFTGTIHYALLENYLNPAGPLVVFAENAPLRLETIRDNVTGLTADEALSLGSDAFEKRYAATLSDKKDEDGEGYHTYEILVHAHNAWQAAILPLPQSNQYLQIRHLLERIAQSRYDADIALSQPIYPFRAKAKDDAFRADTLSAVIMALREPTADSSARQHAKDSLDVAAQQAHSLMTSNRAMVNPQGYQGNIRALLSSIADLTVAAASWPDKVAELAGAYAEHATLPMTTTPLQLKN